MTSPTAALLDLPPLAAAAPSAPPAAATARVSAQAEPPPRRPRRRWPRPEPPADGTSSDACPD